MERGPIYILQRPQPRVLRAETALGYNLLINRNHGEGHQPHIALENDSPLCCRNTRGKYVQRDQSRMSCKPPP
jgi:hypothetical protein